MSAPLHPLTWALWLLAALVLLSATRNPFYLGLTLVWISVVSWRAHLVGLAGKLPHMVAPLRFGLAVIPLTTLVNALNVHVGSTPLFTLPYDLPLIGGPITLEAIVFGFLNGVMLTGIYTAFVLINQILSVSAIVRLIPRVYHPLALVVTIALTFAPLTLRQLHAIREAQAIRGHRMKGMRDWLPLFLPLLLNGLERALQLAEAMTARGFASSPDPTITLSLRLSLVTGLAAVVGGLGLQLGWPGAVQGAMLTTGGAVLIMGTLWLAGRRQPRTVYRPLPFRRQDWLVSAAALGAVLLFLWPHFDRTSLFYYPYPTLSLPGFHLLYGLATWGLLGPIFVLFRGREG